MIYHFNDFTVIQLIHLMRGAEIDFESLQHDSEGDGIHFEFSNEGITNSGQYTLEVHQVNSWVVENSGILLNDIVQQINIFKESGLLEFICKHSLIRAHLRAFEIRAIRRDNK